MMDQSESFIAERKSKVFKEMKEILRKEPNQLSFWATEADHLSFGFFSFT